MATRAIWTAYLCLCVESNLFINNILYIVLDTYSPLCHAEHEWIEKFSNSVRIYLASEVLNIYSLFTQSNSETHRQPW